MKKTVLFLIAILSLFAIACAKKPSNMTHEEKAALLPKKLQPLFKGPWKLDVNASSAMNAKAILAKTGIKADVTFDKDVGKAAQFMAKTLTFTFEKKSLNRAYSEKFGEGLLSTEETGWVTVDDDAKNLTLKDGNDKETAYSIEELEADEKLVLKPKSGGSFEVFIPKGKTPMASAPTPKTADTADSPTTPTAAVAPDAKYKKTSYKAGDRVVGKWISTSYYMATIKAKSGDSYQVTWEDGTSGTVKVDDMVPVVKLKDVKVGDRVAACWHSCRSALYIGTVEKKTATTATVKWNDGSSPSPVNDGSLALF